MFGKCYTKCCFAWGVRVQSEWERNTRHTQINHGHHAHSYTLQIHMASSIFICILFHLNYLFFDSKRCWFETRLLHFQLHFVFNFCCFNELFIRCVFLLMCFSTLSLSLLFLLLMLLLLLEVIKSIGKRNICFLNKVMTLSVEYRKNDFFSFSVFSFSFSIAITFYLIKPTNTTTRTHTHF